MNRIVIAVILIASLAGGALILGTCTGCPGIAPGADKVEVLSERTLSGSVDTIDSFLTFDDAHRAVLKEKLPAVHETAENLRRTAPAIINEARTALAAYRKNRGDPATAASLDAVLAQLDRLAEAARTGLSGAAAAGVK